MQEEKEQKRGLDTIRNIRIKVQNQIKILEQRVRRLIELKKEVNKLSKRLGEPSPYPLEFDKEK